jgi:hypothetical protein
MLLDTVPNMTPKFLGISGYSFSQSLPNEPDFQRAIQTKGGECHQIYQETVGDKTTSPAVRDTLRALDGAMTQNLTRGGEDIQLSSQEFHAALLCGGHFVKNDGGELLRDLLKTGNFEERTSSHYKGSGKQYGMDLPHGMGHLLIGRTNDGGTFFQLESHGTGGGDDKTRMQKLGDFVGHTKSYFKHIGSDEHYVQVGPQGCIAGSEKDQMHVVIH